jgi:hypothetical protein
MTWATKAFHCLRRQQGQAKKNASNASMGLMADQAHIRKQVYLLTADDLNDHPLWEFCPDEEDEEGQDEATVKPSTEMEVPGYSPGAYILASDVTFADGTSATGYVYSGGPDDGTGCTQPNVVTVAGQVSFWLGWLKFVKDPQQEIAKRCALLVKDSASIFPVRFSTRPHINGAKMEIVLGSFMAAGDKLVEVPVR